MPTKINHDLLFKWLISSFIPDFFTHYFPRMCVGSHYLMDKEFYQAYQQFSNHRASDLFLVAEVTIEDTAHEVVIVIEHKSWREDVRQQLMDYCCYAWLQKKKPVWPIAFFTDDHTWEYDDKILFSISEHGRHHVLCDIIQLSRERSADLIARQSLFCKLLALKANATGCKRGDLVRSIYDAVREAGKEIDDETRALIDEFVDTYSKVPEQNLTQIKQEAHVMIAGDTITEHYQLIGREEGKEIGREEGKEIGKEIGRIQGRIESLDELLAKGLITEEVYEAESGPLKARLQKVLDEKA